MLEMSEDSGIDIQAFLMKLILYLYEEPQEITKESPTKKLMVRRLNSLCNTPGATPLDDNVQQLRDWLKMDVPGWQQSIRLHQ
jgi:hypothetical protein